MASIKLGCIDMSIHCTGMCKNTLCIYVIDDMRTRFVRTLSGTICAFLAIKNFARIDAYRARIVIAIPRIVSDCSRTVRPKLADTRFHQSFVTMTPFSCVIMGEFLFARKLFRKR